jgi:hypothetical protein
MGDGFCCGAGHGFGQCACEIADEDLGRQSH